MAQLMTIVSFNDLEPAETLAAKLRDAGFHAEVRDESAEQKWKLFNLHPRAHIQVIVPEEESDAATASARELDRIAHTMKLEAQETDEADRQARIDAYIREAIRYRDLWKAP